MTKLFMIYYALLALLIRPFISVKPKHWVMGADFGRSYREGSKYLLEFMLSNHIDFKCTFITRDRNVFKRLKKENIPCELNFSLRGIIRICESDCVFFSQYVDDILFVKKKKGRNFFYLLHGQPFKCAAKMLEDKEVAFLQSKDSIFLKLKQLLYKHLIVGYNTSDVSFISATSEFEASFLRLEHPGVDVKILGMPRNDILFHPEAIKEIDWIPNLEKKKIVTYMPTHRKYGQGDVSPIPFKNSETAQKKLRDHNIVLLIKQHPNMIKKIKNEYNSDVIIDISTKKLDPQAVIFHTDVLITDYSSVWMDFLLLKRPLLFYFYDEFEDEDAGCYYNLKDEFPENCCINESELIKYIIEAVDNRKYIPSEATINKYHKYIDDKSCQRYYNAIVDIKYS